MKIKSIATALAVGLLSSLPLCVNSQADAAENACKAYFKHPYIVTGRPFKALLTGDEVAEFHTTLFSGTTYRVAVGNTDKNYLIFSVYDTDHNLLFTSKDYENASYWDFSVDGYLDCIIEARLDESVSTSGFAIVMTGFKLNEDKK
ncbi:MAG: hypothetical protein II951_08135 [Bacteroidales bacterium]|nr:hypothetical protein [Bacteroidales bacterium]